MAALRGTQTQRWLGGSNRLQGEGEEGAKDDPGISPSPLGAWTPSFAEPAAA